MSHRLIRDLVVSSSARLSPGRSSTRVGRIRSLPLIIIGAAALGGCVPAGAPAIPFFGAYFPAWLLCAFIGIVGAVLVRVVLIRLGIDDVIPARLPVYLCVAAGIGFLVSILSFGR